MKHKIYIQGKSRIYLKLLWIENINLFAKGSYVIKIKAWIGEKRCEFHLGDQISVEFKPKALIFSTQQKIIQHQNQKVQIQEYVVIESPNFKYCEKSVLSINFMLYRNQFNTSQKVDVQQENDKFQKDKNIGLTFLTQTTIQINTLFSSFMQFSEFVFQQPYLSSIGFLILSQPSYLKIQTKKYKHAKQQQLINLKHQVKKMRYNNYLLSNKFKKYLYGKYVIQFTLPKKFITRSEEMNEMVTEEEHLINYLIKYQDTQMSLEQLNYQLYSIASKNDVLYQIFKQNCAENTIVLNKLRTQYLDKQQKRVHQYINSLKYKDRFADEYQGILKQQMKINKKQLALGRNDQVLNNISKRIFNPFSKDHSVHYPLIIHQTEIKNKQNQNQQQLQNNQDFKQKKYKYLFIFAHGYQGCSQDLTLLANGFKQKFKKCKYFILKSYSDQMNRGLNEIGDMAADQINLYLQNYNFKNQKVRIILIGHSMGGLILRLAAHKIKQKQFLYAFISLGSPHLGYLQGTKLYIKAGMSFFSSICNNVCMNQLASKDKSQLHQTTLFKMSKSGNLGNLFESIILVSSLDDSYTPWHSSRLQAFNRDKLKEQTFIQNQMTKNILEGTKLKRIDRVECQFYMNESSMDKLIGRTSHIKLITDAYFIELFVKGCVSKIFL